MSDPKPHAAAIALSEMLDASPHYPHESASLISAAYEPLRLAVQDVLRKGYDHLHAKATDGTCDCCFCALRAALRKAVGDDIVEEPKRKGVKP